jgi:MFS family permease
LTDRLSRVRAVLGGLVPLFVLAHFSHHVVGALVTPLFPFIRTEFNLTKTQIGFLGSAYNLPYGLSQLPGGWLSDRLGPRRLITVGISGVAVAGLLVGVAPSYALIAAALVLLGATGGGYHPAAAPLVSGVVEERNRGRALGLHQIGGTASFFLTPLIAVGIASAAGWRGSFLWVSVPTLIFGIALYAFLGRRGLAATSSGQSAGSPGPGAGQVDRTRLITGMTLGIAVQVLIFSSISFVPTFVVDVFGASDETGGGLLALAHVAGLLGGPFGGYLSDRLGKTPVLVVGSLVAGPAIFLLSQVSLNWTIGAVLLLMGTCQYVTMPVTESYVISHAPERNRSTLLGIYYAASRGGPALVMPLLGNLADRFSYGTSFTAMAAAMVVIALVSTVILRGSRD